jgi:hypothetical protein
MIALPPAACLPNRRPESLELEHLGVRQSPFATFIGYRVKNAGGES